MYVNEVKHFGETGSERGSPTGPLHVVENLGETGQKIKKLTRYNYNLQQGSLTEPLLVVQCLGENGQKIKKLAHYNYNLQQDSPTEPLHVVENLGETGLELSHGNERVNQ